VAIGNISEHFEAARRFLEWVREEEEEDGPALQERKKKIS
jgi:hypothetical protein